MLVRQDLAVVLRIEPEMVMFPKVSAIILTPVTIEDLNPILIEANTKSEKLS